MYRLATGVYRHVVFPLRGGIRSRGTERVPVEGGLIVAPVHISQLDPPAFAATLKKRRLRAMAKEELWNNKLFGAIIAAIGAFPVKRGAGDTESLRKCIAILQGGEAVIVFPEGTRNDASTMLPLQAGVAMLAKKAGVPVVPVGLAGTQKGAKGRVTVVYGEPFRYEDVANGANERESRKLFLDELASRIQLLCAEAGLQLKSAPETIRRQEYPALEPEVAAPSRE
jgi:1-acyl-sn-glycerol-3-phosphate acyltransferase